MKEEERIIERENINLCMEANNWSRGEGICGKVEHFVLYRVETVKLALGRQEMSTTAVLHLGKKEGSVQM